ncbi:MAG: S1 RNA-binding domain-containing protein [Elusimicrobia bacterium]|nr:S1 RNA-binding domain-containing protein [Elusimicrobiota bacterium]
MDTENGLTTEIEETAAVEAFPGDQSLEPTPQAPPETEESMEALLAQQNRFTEMLVGRKPVWVKVIQVTKAHVLVDIGEKREGMVPLAEFDVTAAAAGKEGGGESRPRGCPSVGQRIPVVLMSSVRSDGATLLSYRRARESLSWEAALKAYTEKSRVRGTVTMHVKGGFLVDVGGVRAFLPASLADLRPVRQPERMVKTGVRCYIIEVNESKKQVVLSRKAVLEEDAAKRRAKVLADIRVGEVRIGRVIHAGAWPSNIREGQGLLVDIGGLDGFVKAADISWGQPKPASDFLRGTKLKVKVLGKPAEGSAEKVSLGIKQLTPNPADALRRKYPPKTTVRGKVVESTQAGLRLRLDDGAAACCPTADCVEGTVYKEGDQVSGVVFGVDPTTFQVGVSLRKFDDVKERKRMASYLKPPPPLTLGELLSPSQPEASDETGDRSAEPAAGRSRPAQRVGEEVVGGRQTGRRDDPPPGESPKKQAVA